MTSHSSSQPPFQPPFQPQDLEQLKQGLSSPELADRLQALTALSAYDTSIAVPLLCHHLNDPELSVRLLVATGLGRKRSPQGQQALETLLQDSDARVRAEALRSLVLFGNRSLAQVWQTFQSDDHALVRAEALETIAHQANPIDLFKACCFALKDPDLALQELAITYLGQFANTDMKTPALDHLQPLAQNPHGALRAALARSLHGFDHHRARETLTQLHDDPDHRVTAAVLEGLV